VKIFFGSFMILCLLSSTQAVARDTRLMLPIFEAMNSRGSERLNENEIQFFFGEQPHPPIIESFGTFVSNKKTNAFARKDKTACEWAFLSAMLSFQKRALTKGGDAVINIHSYYKKEDVSSEHEYMCGAGAIVAGVTFRGEVVKLRLGSTKGSSSASANSQAVLSEDYPVDAKLKMIKQLFEDGLITEEEAAAKRSKILEQLN